jgi:glycosyltransferase involved in cell wall biosynthesis
MASILLLSRYDRMGPSSRVRHINFVPELEAAGFQIKVSPFLSDEYLARLYRGEPRDLGLLATAYWARLRQLCSAGDYDLIWIEKETLPWLPAAIENLFLKGRRIVIDFDDAWYLRYSGHSSGIVRALMADKLNVIAARAAMVTAGSAQLSQWLKSAPCTRVVEIPPAVDLARYPEVPLPEGPFTIGWIGTPGNEAYLNLIAEPLRAACAAAGARLRMIGGSRGFSLPGVAIDYVPWREDTEAAELARCHIGVMPLLDGPWERGKCGYKLIQYMAAGRAAVASPVGAAPSIIVSGQTGLLAGSTEDWIAALTGLATDRERARNFGLAGRQRVERLYSLQINAPKLIAVLKQALAMNVAGEERLLNKTAL